MDDQIIPNIDVEELITNSDVICIDNFIASGGVIDLNDKKWGEMLIYAIIIKQWHVIDNLLHLQKEIGINQSFCSYQDMNGVTPLMHAIKRRRWITIKKLLRACFDPYNPGPDVTLNTINIQSYGGRTALIPASGASG